MRPDPAAIQDLLARARQLVGREIGQVAVGLPGPPRQPSLGHKGWSGEVIEQALGVPAHGEAGPDFPALGIELKTIPLNARWVPVETTHVCTLNLTQDLQTAWEESRVYQKLRHVLFVPLITAPGMPQAERRIGAALLWRPSLEEDALLAQDWEEIISMIGQGELHRVSARIGQVLQLRPKAASGRALTPGRDEEGRPAAQLPRGFYLRTRFTHSILRRLAF